MYNSYKLLVLVAVFGVLTSSSTASAQTAALPSGWSNTDIGSPSIPGTAAAASGVFTVTGSGSDIWDTSDEFQFVYQRVTGDTEIIARVTSIEAAHVWSKAGVMIRGSLTGSSAHAMVIASAAKGWAFQRRPSDGGSSVNTSQAGMAPGWVRLVRQGTLLSAYLSTDGGSWTLIGTETVQLPSTVYVGLAVTSHHSGATATGTFTDVSVGAAPGSAELPVVPAPWATGDIGGPALTGAAAVANDVFTVTGGGSDIWDYSDEFRFVYQRVTGDTEIVARVANLQGAHAWSKAGVMIRAALTGSSAHAALFASSENGWAFQRRQYEGGLSAHTPKAGNTPGWIRLVREGSLITAYHSGDGNNWSVVGTDTISMADAVYIGLAVTSHNVAATATATFTNVNVSAPTEGNTPPSVSMTTPSVGATFTAPATISVSAAASDADGLVTGVTFFANNMMIGSSSAAPFAISWRDVPSGTYSLTAIATDNGGGSATSSPVIVTVGAATTSPSPAPSVPIRLAFTASTDHATTVSSYTVELRRASDPVAASPVATRNLGKPALVDGEVVTDISTLVDPLAPGSYYAVVVAIGSGGSATSSPSATFTK